MPLQTPPMQLYNFRNDENDEIEDVGIIDLHRSDSSVYSEQPEPWVCSKCSYVNVDGRNLFCAMCGTKNESKVLEELNRLSQPEQMLLSVSNADDSMDSVSESGLVNQDVRLPSTNLGEEDIRRFQKSLSIPALNISGHRPGMEDDDADGEAQPVKPSTGRTAYLSHQEHMSSAVERRPSAFQADDLSIMNGSVCSSVLTVASMASEMASSVASSTAVGGSVASSTATPRISNRGHLMPVKVSNKDRVQSDISVTSSVVTEKISNVESILEALQATNKEPDISSVINSDSPQDGHLMPAKVSNKDHIQSDISVASSVVTEKTSNVVPISAPLQATNKEKLTSSVMSSDTNQDGNSKVLQSIPSNPTILLLRTVKSGIYSIDEENDALLPPSTRALSMPVRPQESDTYSTMSEPQKPIRTEDSAFFLSESVDLQSKPTSVARKESESSQYTESTAGRTSIMSSYNDDPSSRADDSPCKIIPRATVLPLHHSENRERYRRDGHNEVYEKERRVARYLFCASSLIVLISIVLMVTLTPPNPQNADFNLPSFAFTSSPILPERVVGDSTGSVTYTPIPSLSPTLSPERTGSPATIVPTEDDGAILLGKLEGIEDSRRIGHSVTLGGMNGDAIAFVGAGAFGLSRFDAGAGNWSAIEIMNSMKNDISETAKISLATEMDRLALAYNGKLEVHEFSASNLKWIRRLVFNDSLNGSVASHTALSMSGDGRFVAFLQPDLGLQMIDVRTWTRYPVSTTPDVSILQVEVSLNGDMLAVLTENGVELKVPDPSYIWVDLVEPISDVKRATAIALSGNGETLAVTSRTHTVLYSLNSQDDETLPTFTIAQGGIALSIDYEGHLLAIGRSKDMLNADKRFNTISLYHRSTLDQPRPFEYGFFEDIQLGDAPGVSISLLTTKNTVEDNTKIAVGAPLDGRKQQGSVRLYQVQQFSIK